MAPLFLLVLAAVSVFAVPEYKDLDQGRDHENTDGIIGGVPADIEEFPFIVSLIYETKKGTTSDIRARCGGTIINDDWVLTAGHCLVTNMELPNDTVRQLINVRAGSSFSDREGILRQVIETVSHTYPKHDIGLIKIDEPWPLNGVTISRAHLPRQDDPIPVGSPATIMGWGLTEEDGTVADILMKQTVEVISHDTCWDAYIWKLIHISDKHICTFTRPGEEQASVSGGDSGGPVLVNGEVVGVVAGGLTGLPNIHTRVSFYIDWIEENVAPVPEYKDLDQGRDHENTDGIIGGVPADIEEFPFIVSLIYAMKTGIISDISPLCAGTIINDDWVLTAAHCLDTNMKVPNGAVVQLINVRAGSSFSDRGGILRIVIETVSHHFYNFPEHDIGLLKVDEPWPFNGVNILPARLPQQGDPVPAGSPAMIMGWGDIDMNGTSPEVLMKQEMVIISHSSCAESYIQILVSVTDKQICTSFRPGEKPSATNHGDSGGPVQVNGEVVGIVSGGDKELILPGFHTRVSSYIDWIKKNMGPLPSAK